MVCRQAGDPGEPTPELRVSPTSGRRSRPMMSNKPRRGHGGVFIESWTMALLCKIFGHRWSRLENTPVRRGWSYENHTCTRCGEDRRQLVADREG